MRVYKCLVGEFVVGYFDEKGEVLFKFKGETFYSPTDEVIKALGHLVITIEPEITLSDEDMDSFYAFEEWKFGRENAQIIKDWILNVANNKYAGELKLN